MVQENSMREAAERLATDGFVFLDQFCASDLITGILRIARTESREVQEALGTGDIGIGSAAGYNEIVQRSPGRWDVPITPQQYGIDEEALPWATLVSAVLGAGAERSFSGVVFSDPGSPAQFWHTDSPHEAPEHRAPHALNVPVRSPARAPPTRTIPPAHSRLARCRSDTTSRAGLFAPEIP